MLLFALGYSVAEMVAWVLVVAQFAYSVVMGETHPRLQGFGADLSTYIYRIWRFLTFNSDTLPWPFEPWRPGEAAEPPEVVVRRD